jgi:CheY-like chemotaxis protein/DNA-directed RNA polymerase specialized sigma24 family protein
MPTQGLKAALGPHLPYLRRYGRALTGSQSSGDAFVRAALEALLAAPDQIVAGNAPRVELFRLFHAIWTPVAETVGADDAGDDGVWRHPVQAVGEGLLSGLPRSRREALLLTAVEGFSIEDVCIILDRDEAAVRADILAAREEISRALAGRVLIIEDEPVIAMHLQDIVEDMGHSVVGLASTHAEATELSRSTAPDLVLADIRLADGSSGVDAVKEILADRSVPVVFITAYPERLLTGERPEPTYLVTKPFEVETIVTTIGQALMMHRAGREAA